MDDDIKNEVLAGLENIAQDPSPAASRRGPGRPRGSKTAAPKKIAHRAPTGRAMSKDQLKRQVAVEMYGFASMFVGILELKDEECVAPAYDVVDTPDGKQERLAAIVDRMVNILARNDKVLSFMATSGVVGEMMMLGGLLIPWGKKVWQAHGPGGTGHREENSVDDLARYPAPALA